MSRATGRSRRACSRRRWRHRRSTRCAPAGFLATANADPIGVTAENDPFKRAPVVDGIPLYIGADFDAGTRVGRITKRLNAVDKLSLADVQSVQADVVSEYGPLYSPTLL